MNGAANAVPEKVQRDIPAEKKKVTTREKRRGANCEAQRREAQRREAQRREAQGERRKGERRKGERRKGERRKARGAERPRRKKARRGGERRNKGERRKDARGGEARMRDAKRRKETGKNPQKGSGARCPTSFVMKLCASIIFRPPPDGAFEASLVDSNA